MTKSPISYALTCFILSFILLGFFIGELVCNDGWVSPSIGKSGACSHHDGINYIPIFLQWVVSIALSVFVYKMLGPLLENPSDITKERLKKLEDSQRKGLNRLEITLIFFNKVFCMLWNTGMKLGYFLRLNKNPLTLVIIGVVILFVFPPFFLFCVVVVVWANLNGANSSCKYLIPTEKIKGTQQGTSKV
jgi:hypothetical protein